MTVWTVILILPQIILADVFFCDSAGKESGCKFLAECWLIDIISFITMYNRLFFKQRFCQFMIFQINKFSLLSILCPWRMCPFTVPIVLLTDGFLA